MGIIERRRPFLLAAGVLLTRCAPGIPFIDGGSPTLVNERNVLRPRKVQVNPENTIAIVSFADQTIATFDRSAPAKIFQALSQTSSPAPFAIAVFEARPTSSVQEEQFKRSAAKAFMDARFPSREELPNFALISLEEVAYGALHAAELEGKMPETPEQFLHELEIELNAFLIAEWIARSMSGQRPTDAEYHRMRPLLRQGVLPLMVSLQAMNPNAPFYPREFLGYGRQASWKRSLDALAARGRAEQARRIVLGVNETVQLGGGRFGRFGIFVKNSANDALLSYRPDTLNALWAKIPSLGVFPGTFGVVIVDLVPNTPQDGEVIVDTFIQSLRSRGLQNAGVSGVVLAFLIEQVMRRSQGEGRGILPKEEFLFEMSVELNAYILGLYRFARTDVKTGAITIFQPDTIHEHRLFHEGAIRLFQGAPELLPLSVDIMNKDALYASRWIVKTAS